MNKSNPMYNKLIEMHEKCIKILEGIIHFERKRQSIIRSLEGIPGTFCKLRREYLNDIDTIDRCINRLKQRYSKLMRNECD